MRGKRRTGLVLAVAAAVVAASGVAMAQVRESAEPPPTVGPSTPRFPGFLLLPGERADALPPGVVAPEPAAAGPASACSEISWTGGTTEWCGGALVYRDHVYDDTGADTAPGSRHGAPSSAATGDVDHGAHGQAGNSADLLVLRLREVDGGLHARFELNTLFPGDRTIAAVAVDVDDDRTTGGGQWPRVAVRSAGWDVVGILDDRDAGANVVEGLVRVALPAAGTIRVQAVVALGDGTPMNVAFRADDTGAWWEEEQAAALTTGDVSRFGQRIAVEDLRAGLDRPAPLRTGFQQRVRWSAQALGEGIAFPPVVGETASPWTHVGHHQPYALYVPDPVPDDVQLLLHGSTSSHTAVLSPGMRATFGDGQRRILVSPFGRGDTGGFLDWSAHDALGALADVERLFRTDPDTVIVSGYSMGGGGSLQLASWFPDRFAAVVAIVPFTGDCVNGTPLAQGDVRPPLVAALDPLDPTNLTSNDPEDRSGCPLATRGNTADLTGNLVHVPTAMLFGAVDELVWPNHALGAAGRFRAAGVEHRIWLEAVDHFLPAVLDRWEHQAAWSAGRRRPDHVALVQYTANVFQRVPELGIVPDGAYWVDGIEPRLRVATPDGDAEVRLLSHACPSGGERELSVAADAGLTPVPWVGQVATVVREHPTDGTSRITGTLRNVASLVIDVDAACIGREPLTLDVRVDGPTEVRFSDGRPTVVLRPT